MKIVYTFIFCCCVMQFANAQNVGIGTATPNPKAALEIKSNNQGFLMPRLSKAARLAITNVPKGMIVYDTTYTSFYYHDGSTWRSITDRNPDNLLVDYSTLPQDTINIGSVSSTVSLSGLLYDDGGPNGNYSNNISETFRVLTDNNDERMIRFKVVVEEMNLESPYDTLEIFTQSNIANKILLTGTTTGVYYFNADRNVSGKTLYFRFKSNAANNLSGFKIRWSQLFNDGASIAETAPAYGWYFNQDKLAVRGGLEINNTWSNDSTGYYSFGYGYNTKAKGFAAISMGNVTSATGVSAIALGSNAIAAGDNSTSIGSFTNASGKGSIAIGNNSKASSYYSIALGGSSEASGSNATALGNSLASGDRSTAMGKGKATGDYATAMGKAEATGDYATAMGNTFAYGLSSSAVGESNYATGYGTFAIGVYNDSVVPRQTTIPSGLIHSTTPLFIIGNGNNITKKNAMVVLKNGNTGIGTNSPKTKLQITDGSDASLSPNSGYLVLGDVTGTNMVIDNNEIIARNNGANATLTLQNTGGDLQTGGNAFKPGGGSWSAASDARLKENIQPYKQGLQQILKINPVTFHYNQLSGLNTKPEYVGVLAQELKSIAPNMVGTFTKDSTEYYQVDNSAMTYMLINAVKEQQQQIKTLQTKIDELQLAIKSLVNKHQK